MKYFVNENCIACGLCVSTCPDIFKMTDEGRAKALDIDVPEDSREAAEEAENNCPVDAIEEA